MSDLSGLGTRCLISIAPSFSFISFISVHIGDGDNKRGKKPHEALESLYNDIRQVFAPTVSSSDTT